MAAQFAECSELVSRLVPALRDLEREAAMLELAPLPGRDWFEVLQRKLVPQLGDDSYLVVAVVGGTNIGKSVIFNHLAGYRASATSPLASGTRHATVLMPPGFSQRHNLSEIFPGFELIPWQAPEQALAEDERHLLFWRERSPDAATERELPDNLLILDTPDVDSVALVNWERADHIRQCADVLIAVLTQQKYNDAAVKEFFRKAAQEHKLVLVVFNQCLLPEDEEYWPIWVETFCRETGIEPAGLFVAPSDRRAAEAIRLPFYERPWPIPERYAPPTNPVSSDIMQELAELRFGDIKLKTLSGSLQQLVDLQLGVPHWLKEISRRAGQFEEAAGILSTNRLAQIDRWPNIPNSALIAHIRTWWSDQREGWAANVHQFYNGVGQVVSMPFKMLKERTTGPQEPPLDIYRKQEWDAVLQTVERVFDRLSWMRDLGNPLLIPRLDKLLTGNARADFINGLRQRHAAVDFDVEIQSLVRKQLTSFRESSPDYYQFFRRLDTFAAAARPAVSVALFLTGVGPVGDVLVPAMANSALHFASEAVGATVLTTVGDKVIAEGASTGAGYLEAQFRQLHSAFAQSRADWLAHELQIVLGTLPHELAQAAAIPKSSAYREVTQQLSQLRKLIQALDTTG